MTQCGIIILGVSMERDQIVSIVYEHNRQRLETKSRRFMAILLYEDMTWRKVARLHNALVLELD